MPGMKYEEYGEAGLGLCRILHAGDEAVHGGGPRDHLRRGVQLVGEEARERVGRILPLPILYKDPRHARDEVPQGGTLDMFKHMFVNPLKHPDFGLVRLSRFLAGLVIAATSASVTGFTVAWMVFAVGQAMYLTVDLALCAQVLPNEADTGKDMAVFGLALNLPTILVPAAAPAILGAGNNYTLLWGIAAVLCALGAVVIPLVKGVK